MKLRVGLAKVSLLLSELLPDRHQRISSRRPKGSIAVLPSLNNSESEFLAGCLAL